MRVQAIDERGEVLTPVSLLLLSTQTLEAVYWVLHYIGPKAFEWKAESLKMGHIEAWEQRKAIKAGQQVFLETLSGEQIGVQIIQ